MEDYKTKIIVMVEKIENIKSIKFIYYFVKSILKEEQAGG